MFAQRDFFGALQPAAIAARLRVDNVADAYTLYWITAYQATRGVNPTPDRRTVEAVRQQALNALARTGEFARAGDATKQEIAGAQ